jgi:hypothetical protein
MKRSIFEMRIILLQNCILWQFPIIFLTHILRIRPLNMNGSVNITFVGRILNLYWSSSLREISTDVSVAIWINSIAQHMLRTRDDQKKLRVILEIIHTQKADMQQLMSYKSLIVIYSTLIIEDGQTLFLFTYPWWGLENKKFQVSRFIKVMLNVVEAITSKVTILKTWHIFMMILLIQNSLINWSWQRKTNLVYNR